ncbi:MAG: DUF342 domain-containing protein [Spirochaetaceae bacterium]|nr:MAG: DUF342 domain-containing protein [Spirochaetaceae bacterium]
MDRDGYVEIAVSTDAMSVFGHFYPPQGEGRHLTPDYLESQLEAWGITFGVMTEEVAEIMFEVNTSHRGREGVLLAQGAAPVAARPAFYRVTRETRPREDTSGDRADRVDHRSVTRLPVVRRDEVVARLVPAVEGRPGSTVRGEEIPFPTLPVEALQPGNNTRVEGDVVLAAIGGQLQFRDGFFHVENSLEISGDVGYETGSVEFPGDVSLKGEVRDGFHIWAGGSITAAGTVDVSEIYCRGDFSTSGGVVGRGKALLRSGGRITCRFIGNCNVETKSSLFVKQYIYHSSLGILDRLAMGNRGRIIGGTITATEGIRCYVAGNPANVPTVIRVGINFIVERKLRHCFEKQQATTTKLNKLSAALPGDPSDRQLDILHRLEKTRNGLMSEMSDLAGELDRHEDAEVIVEGDVFPGVQIQICRATFLVEEKMGKVRFFLDKTTGRVIAQSLVAR